MPVELIKYKDGHGEVIGKGCHVHVVRGLYQGQEGVVVTFEEGMRLGGGPVIVYMRELPAKIFLDKFKGEQVVNEQHRAGIPDEGDWMSNPLAAPHEGSDLMVISTSAPPRLIGKPQPRTNYVFGATGAADTRSRMIHHRVQEAPAKHPEFPVFAAPPTAP